jgi:hypothetical protein
MQHLEVRRIYVDSRYCVPGGTGSDFEYELAEGVDLPPDSYAHISEFTTVNSWATVGAQNQNLYVVERVGSAWRPRIVVIPTGAYDTDTLRQALQDGLNASRAQGVGAYAVTRTTSDGGSTFNTSGGVAYRYYTVTNTSTFYFPGRDLLSFPQYRADWISLGGPAYDIANLKSTHELFSFPLVEYPQFASTSAQSSYVDLRALHTVYLHSPSFGNGCSIGPGGVRTILLKIPVLAAFGNLITFQSPGYTADLMPVSTRCLRRMQFTLRDSRGNVVDLQGGHISFTIVLSTE